MIIFRLTQQLPLNNLCRLGNAGSRWHAKWHYIFCCSCQRRSLRVFSNHYFLINHTIGIGEKMGFFLLGSRHKLNGLISS